MNRKLAILPVIAVLSIGFSTLATAAGNDCNAKRIAIENQIREAQKYGNYHKVEGLKKALREVNAHCTDASLVKDAQKKIDKLEDELRDKQRDVREVQADLREAQARGDAKKLLNTRRNYGKNRPMLKRLTINCIRPVQS